jgi:transposase
MCRGIILACLLLPAAALHGSASHEICLLRQSGPGLASNFAAATTHLAHAKGHTTPRKDHTVAEGTEAASAHVTHLCVRVLSATVQPLVCRCSQRHGQPADTSAPRWRAHCKCSFRVLHLELQHIWCAHAWWGVRVLCVLPNFARCAQQLQCPICQQWKDTRLWHGKQCRDCYNLQHPPHPRAAPSAAAAVPDPPAAAVSARAHLSPWQRVRAAVLREDGQSATTVAAKLHTTPRAVERWSARIAAQQNLAAASDAPRSGRPLKLTEEQLVNVAVTSRMEPFATPRGIKRKLNLDDVSHRTVSRALEAADIPVYVAPHKRHLTDEEKHKRLSFAEGYKHWTADDWCNVLFADEKLFYGEGRPGRVFVRIPRDADRKDPKYTVHMVPHPPKVPAWACFCGQGPGYMCVYEDSANAKFFARIYKEYLVPSHRLFFEEGKAPRWLLQDNLKAHTTPPADQALHNAAFIQLDFPTYSPDLNPIENLWKDVQERMDLHPGKNKEQVETALMEEWKHTDPKLCRKLARSMPKRLAQVIARGGEYIHY